MGSGISVAPGIAQPNVITSISQNITFHKENLEKTLTEEDDNFDTLGAGVKLAQESAIILEGVVEIQPTKNRNEVSNNKVKVKDYFKHISTIYCCSMS